MLGILEPLRADRQSEMEISLLRLRRLTCVSLVDLSSPAQAAGLFYARPISKKPAALVRGGRTCRRLLRRDLSNRGDLRSDRMSAYPSHNRTRTNDGRDGNDHSGGHIHIRSLVR